MTEHGGILFDGVQKASTHKCPHCQRHFLLAKGNLDAAKQELSAAGLADLARPKHYCSRCGRLTCGHRLCVMFCIPSEASLEHVEGKITKYTDLIIERGSV